MFFKIFYDNINYICGSVYICGDVYEKEIKQEKIIILCMAIPVAVALLVLLGAGLSLVIGYHQYAYEKVPIVDRSDEYIEPLTDAQPDGWENVTVNQQHLGMDLDEIESLTLAPESNARPESGFNREQSFGRSSNVINVTGKTPIYKVEQKDPDIENILIIGTDDGDYYTLGDTDHLIFIALHMIKHFILCGMSLRMVSDIALFITSKRAEIDFDRVRSVLKKLNYDELFLTVIRAAEIYMEFDASDFPDSERISDEKVEMVLTDLETGGWLGKNNQSARKDGWREYSRLIMLKKKSKISYWIYMFRWQNEFSAKALFPPKKRLVGNYPCLNRFPWLLPLVWLHRILFKGIKKGKKTKEKIVFSENNISEESKRRVEMFRLLGIL